MAEAPRYQRGEKSSAAAPRDAKRQRTQPFAAQTCMAPDGPAASTAPDANGLLLCGRCVKFNNNAKPRKPREKVVPPPTRKEALAEYWLVAQTLAATVRRGRRRRRAPRSRRAKAVTRCSGPSAACRPRPRCLGAGERARRGGAGTTARVVSRQRRAEGRLEGFCVCVVCR